MFELFRCDRRYERDRAWFLAVDAAPLASCDPAAELGEFARPSLDSNIKSESKSGRFKVEDRRTYLMLAS